jgi:DNA processing protein
MNTLNALYIHAFNLLPQFGPARLLRLCENFETPKEAFFANLEDLTRAGIEPELAKTFIDFRLKLDLEQEQKKLDSENIKLLFYKQENYPVLLKEIPKFPPLLYYRGTLDTADELCVAVVGSRKITTYGLTVIPDLISPIVDAGVTIVSGMAFGVDSEAHKQSILKNQRTIAVLGGGLDDKSLYPKHHQLLAQEILDAGGALVSEYPIGTPNFKQNFVARNRIISGLSVATVVIECDLESGSLITAKHALDQNRQVFAVPGPIYAEMSKGPNNLIKMGAKLVTEANDILEDLNLKTLPEQKQTQLTFLGTPDEMLVLKLLSKQPKNINAIIKESGLEAGKVTSALTFLEMKGRVKNLGGQQYIVSR